MPVFPAALRSAIGKRLVPLAFLNIFLIWGSTFLAISYGLRGFPPFLLSALRFISAGLILLAWQYARGVRITNRADWLRNAVPGLFILTAGTGLVAWSEQYVTSSEAAIMGATAPFWFIVLDRQNRKAYLTDRLVLAGIIGGFIGLVLFVNGSISTAHPAHATGNRPAAFVVLALSAVSWVLGSVYSRRKPASGPNLLNTAQQLLAGGLGSLIISLLRSEPAQAMHRTVPLSAWAGLIFLIVFGSIIAYQSYIWLLSVRPPAIVSVHTYVNPVVAVVIGWIFLQEVATGLQLAGLVVILAGVFLTNISRYKIRIRTKVRIRQKLRYAFHAVEARSPRLAGFVARLNH